MSTNLHSIGQYGKKFSEIIKSGMLRVIAEAAPAIVAIQEFYTRQEGSFDIRDSLMDIGNTKHHHIEVIEKNDFETRGLAIFSRYPIEKQEAVHLKGHQSYN